MRWTYLIFLVFSAWMYQRIIFYPPVINSRSPSSVSSESCMSLMQGFYPTQTKDFLEKRLSANKDFHSFYRAFVPLFYDAIEKDPEIAKVFSPLGKYKAAMGGDVHVENFGFVLNSSGSARLVLNDVDDVTDGQIYMDVMRHYISGKIVSDDVHLNNYLEAYQSGLKNEKYVFSNYVKTNKQNATSEIKTFLNQYISIEEPIKFIKYKRPMYVIDEARKNEILDALTQSYKKIKIYDEYLRIKEDGGSAGLLRYEVLAQLTPGEDPIWLDIKAMTGSSYDKVFTKSAPSYSSRMSLIKNSIYEKDLTENISIIQLAGQSFSVRFMNQFGLGVAIEDIPIAELSDVVLDEAYALGQMHARSLGKLSNGDNLIDQYSKAWESISQDDIKKAAKTIRENLEKKYTSKI